MAQSSRGYNTDPEDDRADALPLDTEDRASTNLRSPEFQKPAVEPDPPAPRFATPMASALESLKIQPSLATSAVPLIPPVALAADSSGSYPLESSTAGSAEDAGLDSASPSPDATAPEPAVQAPRLRGIEDPGVNEALAQVGQQPEQMRPPRRGMEDAWLQEHDRQQRAGAEQQAGIHAYLKSKGVQTETLPDGSQAIATHPDGAPVWKPASSTPFQDPTSGQWLVRQRDARGQLHDVSAHDVHGAVHTDAATGDQYVYGVDKQPVKIGTDPVVAAKSAVTAQRSFLYARENQASAQISNLHAALEPVREQYRVLQATAATESDALGGKAKSVRQLENERQSLQSAIDGGTADDSVKERYKAAADALDKFGQDHPEYGQIRATLDSGKEQIRQIDSDRRRDRDTRLQIALGQTSAAVHSTLPDQSSSAQPGGISDADPAQVARDVAVAAGHNGTTQASVLPAALRQMKANGAKTIGGRPIDEAIAAASATPAPPAPKPTPRPDGNAYTLDEKTGISFSPEKPADGLRQALEDGKIDPDYAKEHMAKFQEVQQKYEDLVKSAGSAPKVKALLRGAGRGGVFLAGSAPGAAAGAAITSETGPGAIIGGAIGGLITGTAATWGYDKLLAKVGEYSKAVKSLNDAAELHPMYSGAGELVAFASSAPKSIMNLTKAASMAKAGALAEGLTDVAGNTAARKVVGKNLLAAAAGGTGFTGLQYGFDAARYKAADALGMDHGELQMPDANALATNVALAMLTHGHSIKFQKFDADTVARVIANGDIREAAGIPLDKKSTPEAITAAYQAHGIALEPEAAAQLAVPMYPQEIGLRAALKRQQAHLEAKGAFKGFASAEQAQGPGHLAAVGETGESGEPPMDFTTPPEQRQARAFSDTLRKHGILKPKVEGLPADHPIEDRVRLSDQLGETQNALNEAHRTAVEAVPEVARKAIAATIGGKAEAIQAHFEEQPDAAFQAAHVGRELRDLYTTPDQQARIEGIAARVGEHGPAAKFVADQYAGMKAARDLTAIAALREVPPERVAGLQRMGLVEMENGQPMVTHDALPLLPRGLTARLVDAHDSYRVKSLHGEKMQGAAAMVRAGQGQLEQALHAKALASRPPAEAKPHLVRVQFTGKGGKPGETTFEERAQSEEDALAKAMAHVESKGTVKAAHAEITTREKEQARKKAKDTPPADPLGPNRVTSAKLSDFTPAEQQFANLVGNEYKRNQKYLAALGISKVELVRNSADLSGLTITDRALRIDASQLKKQADIFSRQGVKAKEWARAAIQEEVWHAIQFKAAGADFQSHYADLHSALSPEMLAHAREVYTDFDSLPKHAQAAEVERMILQQKWNGTITEKFIASIEKILAYLRGLKIESPLLKESIARVEAVREEAIRAAQESERGSDNAPAESRTPAEPEPSSPPASPTSSGPDLEPARAELPPAASETQAEGSNHPSPEPAAPGAEAQAESNARIMAEARKFSSAEEFGKSLANANADLPTNNILDAPFKWAFKEGKLFVDDYGENPYVYEARYVDPFMFKGDLKLEGMTYQQVVDMPTTQRYIEWLREGHEPPPISVVIKQETGNPYSTNRRRVVAALEAGVKRIPALVEVGRRDDLWKEAQAEPDAPTRKPNFKFTVNDGGFSQDPIVARIIEHGGLLSKSSTKQQMGGAKYARNAGESEDSATMQHPSHNALYSKDGMSPDEAVAVLHGDGRDQPAIVREGFSTADLWAHLDRASKTAKRIMEQEAGAKKDATDQRAKDRAFTKDTKTKGRGERELTAWDISPGDTVKVGTESMKVISVDAASGSFVLEDGKKYGLQEVDGHVFGKLEKAEAPAADPLLLTESEARMVGQSEREPASWIIRNKETGEVMTETRQRSVAEKVNKAKYEAVPGERHMREMNDPSTTAHKWANRSTDELAASRAKRKDDGGQRDMFAGADAPFNLAGEKGEDGFRVSAEREQARKDAEEAARRRETDQMTLFASRAKTSAQKEADRIAKLRATRAGFAAEQGKAPEATPEPHILTKPEGRSVINAYHHLARVTQFPAVSIADLADQSGIPLDKLKQQLLRSHKTGSVVLSTGDWSLASDKVKSGAIDMPGANHGDRPMLQVRFLNDAGGMAAAKAKREQDALGFYSHLARTVDAKIPNRGTPEQILGTLKGAGVKPSEMDWMGLPQFFEGKQSVSKDDLRQFIAENSVQMKEVVKGDGRKPVEQSELDDIADDLDRIDSGDFWDFTDSDDTKAVEMGDKAEGAIREASEALRAGDHERGMGLLRYAGQLESDFGDDPTTSHLRKKLEKITSEEAREPDTKFSQYALPGGTNYREKLLTLPEKAEPTKGYYIAKAGDYFAVYDGRQGLGQFDTMAEAQDFLRGKIGPNLTKQNFHSSHWDEPNVLAHTREADHADTEGNKVRLIEEIQSDWHQKGRKEGYQQAAAAKMDERRKAIEDEMMAMVRAHGGHGNVTATPRWQELDSENRAISDAKTTGVPDAPFKKTWPEVAFKRALRSAVDDGMDKVAWVTGDIAADRFDLSKQVDSIVAIKRGDKFTIIARKDGMTEPVTRQEDLTADKLPDLIGKDLAQKIANQEEGRHSYAGEDLKVGGAGMRGFYDKILPDFVRKYVKPWGGKVETTRIGDEARGAMAKVESEGDGWAVMVPGEPEPVYKSKTKAEAQKVADQWHLESGTLSKEVHSVTITPAMRESVQGEGQSLFASKAVAAAHAKVAQAIAPFRDEVKSAGLKHEISQDFDSPQTHANIRGLQMQTRIRLGFERAIPKGESRADRKAREAAVAQDLVAARPVVEAGGNRAKLAAELAKVNTSPDAKLRKTFAPIYQYALANFDRLNRMLAAHTKLANENYDALKAAGVDVGKREDYVHRVTTPPEDPSAPHLAFEMGNGNGSGNARGMLKGRSFDTMGDAIKAGYDPGTYGIHEADGRMVQNATRIIGDKAFLDKMKQVKAPTDGKPIISQLTTRKLANGKTEQKVPDGYAVVNAMGRPVVIHKMFAPLFSDLYGTSAIRNLAAGRALLKLAALGKHGTLVFDTFHGGRILYKMAGGGGGFPIVMRDGKPAFNYHAGLSLLEYSDADLDVAHRQGEITATEVKYARQHRVALDELVKAGLNVGKVADNLMDQVKRHIPVVSTLNDWLFSKLSRGAMVQTAMKFYERNLTRPGMSREQAARRTATEMNEYFGNLQNQGIFKSKTLQDIARLVFLAPNWTESQARYEARAYGQLGASAVDAARGRGFRAGNATRAMATGFVALLAANQVANYLSRGQSTFENEEDGHKLDAWVPGGKRGFWFNPFEIAGEYAHAAMKYSAQHENPVDVATHIASNKLSPLARGVKEAGTGRDAMGRHFLSDADRARSSIVDALPSPLPAGAFFEKDPRSNVPHTPLDTSSAGAFAQSALDNIAPPGYRANRQPGSIQKQAMQSIGAKVTPVQSPRTAMFALAQPFRKEGQYSDNAGEYTQLRASLDQGDDASSKVELKWLLDRGKDLKTIASALGIHANGVTPEKFTGSKEGEAAMMKALTPQQRKMYDAAQADHQANAKKFLAIARSPEGQQIVAEARKKAAQKK